MGVPFGLNQSAGHVAVCVIATIAVGMALGFRLSAGKRRFAFCIAGGIMGMTLGLFQCAGLLAPPIAAVGVGMSILAADQLGLHRHSGQRTQSYGTTAPGGRFGRPGAMSAGPQTSQTTGNGRAQS